MAELKPMILAKPRTVNFYAVRTHWASFTVIISTHYLSVNQSWIKKSFLNDIPDNQSGRYGTQAKFHRKINTFLSQICHQAKRNACTFTLETLTRNWILMLHDRLFRLQSIAWHLILTAMSTKSRESKVILSRHQLIYVISMERNGIEAYDFFFIISRRSIWWMVKYDIFTYLVIKQKAHLCFSVPHLCLVICIAKNKQAFSKIWIRLRVKCK